MKVTGRGMEGGRVSPVSVLGILTSSIGKTSALVSVTSGHLSPLFFDDRTRSFVIGKGCYTQLNLEYCLIRAEHKTRTEVTGSSQIWI